MAAPLIADPGRMSAIRREGLWAGSIGLFDMFLRACYGIREFAEDPDCVLRLGLSRVRAPVLLADGTYIAPGEIVGTLHLWNEQLPRYSHAGPDLGWACKIRDRITYSLGILAGHVTREPEWRDVCGFRADAALSSRLGAVQLRRVARRYGFEQLPQRSSLLGRLYAFGDSVTLWGLARAYNPVAVSRQPFLRERCELWISRSALLSRYANRAGHRT